MLNIKSTDPRVKGTKGLESIVKLQELLDKELKEALQLQLAALQGRADVITDFSPEEDITNDVNNSGYGDSYYDLYAETLSDIKNLNEVRALQEGASVKLLNGIGKFGVNLATTWASDVIGFATGVVSMSVNRDASKFWDNGFNRAMQTVLEWSESVMPNYRTEEELNNKWYQNVLSANFIGDTIIKNAGFTVGAGLGMMSGVGLVSGLGRGIKALSKAAKLGKSFEKGAETVSRATRLTENGAKVTAEATERGLQSAKNALGIISTMKNVTDLSSTSRALVGSFYSALGEGSIEALNNSKESVTNWTNAINKAYDDEVTIAYAKYGNSSEFDRAVAEALAKKLRALAEVEESRKHMGNLDLILNLPLLTLENMFAFGKVITKSYNPLKAEKNLGIRRGANSLIKSDAKNTVGLINGAEVSGVKAAKNTFAKKAWAFLKTPLIEGNEEMSLMLASKAAENYYGLDIMNAYDGMLSKEDRAATRDFGKAAILAFCDSYLDSNSWEEGFVGALMGGAGMPKLHTAKKKNADGTTSWRCPISFEGSAFDNLKEHNEKYARALKVADYVNNRIQDPEFVKLWNNVVALTTYNRLADLALLDGDTLRAEDLKNKSVITDIRMFDEAGHLDVLQTAVNASKVDLNSDTLQTDLETIQKQGASDNGTNPWGKYNLAEKSEREAMAKEVNDEVDKFLGEIKEYKESKDYFTNLLSLRSKEEGVDLDRIDEVIDEFVWANLNAKYHYKNNEKKLELSRNFYNSALDYRIQSLNSLLSSATTDEDKERILKLINKFSKLKEKFNNTLNDETALDAFMSMLLLDTDERDKEFNDDRLAKREGNRGIDLFLDAILSYSESLTSSNDWNTTSDYSKRIAEKKRELKALLQWFDGNKSDYLNLILGEKTIELLQKEKNELLEKLEDSEEALSYTGDNNKKYHLAQIKNYKDRIKEIDELVGKAQNSTPSGKLYYGLLKEIKELEELQANKNSIEDIKKAIDEVNEAKRLLTTALDFKSSNKKEEVAHIKKVVNEVYSKLSYSKNPYLKDIAKDFSKIMKSFNKKDAKEVARYFKKKLTNYENSLLSEFKGLKLVSIDTLNVNISNFFSIILSLGFVNYYNNKIALYYNNPELAIKDHDKKAEELDKDIESDDEKQFVKDLEEATTVLQIRDILDNINDVEERKEKVDWLRSEVKRKGSRYRVALAYFNIEDYYQMVVDRLNNRVDFTDELKEDCRTILDTLYENANSVLDIADFSQSNSNFYKAADSITDEDAKLEALRNTASLMLEVNREIHKKSVLPSYLITEVGKDVKYTNQDNNEPTIPNVSTTVELEDKSATEVFEGKHLDVEKSYTEFFDKLKEDNGNSTKYKESNSIVPATFNKKRAVDGTMEDGYKLLNLGSDGKGNAEEGYTIENNGLTIKVNAKPTYKFLELLGAFNWCDDGGLAKAVLNKAKVYFITTSEFEGNVDGKPTVFMAVLKKGKAVSKNPKLSDFLIIGDMPVDVVSNLSHNYLIVKRVREGAKGKDFYVAPFTSIINAEFIGGVSFSLEKKALGNIAGSDKISIVFKTDSGWVQIKGGSASKIEEKELSINNSSSINSGAVYAAVPTNTTRGNILIPLEIQRFNEDYLKNDSYGIITLIANAVNKAITKIYSDSNTISGVSFSTNDLPTVETEVYKIMSLYLYLGNNHRINIRQDSLARPYLVIETLKVENGKVETDNEGHAVVEKSYTVDLLQGDEKVKEAITLQLKELAKESLLFNIGAFTPKEVLLSGLACNVTEFKVKGNFFSIADLEEKNGKMQTIAEEDLTFMLSVPFTPSLNLPGVSTANNVLLTHLKKSYKVTLNNLGTPTITGNNVDLLSEEDKLLLYAKAYFKQCNPTIRGDIFLLPKSWGGDNVTVTVKNGKVSSINNHDVPGVEAYTKAEKELFEKKPTPSLTTNDNKNDSPKDERTSLQKTVDAIIEKCVQSKQYVKTTDDHEYIFLKDGNKIKLDSVHDRMSLNTKKEEDKESNADAIPYARNGSAVDAISRDCFLDSTPAYKDGSRVTEDGALENDDALTEEAFNELTKGMKDFKEKKEKEGMVFLPKDVVVYIMESGYGKTGVAGEVDLVGIDKDGKIHIYDFKTMSAPWETTKSKRSHDDYSTKADSYGALLNSYVNMMSTMLGNTYLFEKPLIIPIVCVTNNKGALSKSLEEDAKKLFSDIDTRLKNSTHGLVIACYVELPLTVYYNQATKAPVTLSNGKMYDYSGKTILNNATTTNQLSDNNNVNLGVILLINKNDVTESSYSIKGVEVNSDAGKYNPFTTPLDKRATGIKDSTNTEILVGDYIEIPTTGGSLVFLVVGVDKTYPNKPRLVLHLKVLIYKDGKPSIYLSLGGRVGDKKKEYDASLKKWIESDLVYQLDSNAFICTVSLSYTKELEVYNKLSEDEKKAYYKVASAPLATAPANTSATPTVSNLATTNNNGLPSINIGSSNNTTLPLTPSNNGTVPLNSIINAFTADVNAVDLQIENDAQAAAVLDVINDLLNKVNPDLIGSWEDKLTSKVSEVIVKAFSEASQELKDKWKEVPNLPNEVRKVLNLPLEQLTPNTDLPKTQTPPTPSAAAKAFGDPQNGITFRRDTRKFKHLSEEEFLKELLWLDRVLPWMSKEDRIKFVSALQDKFTYGQFSNGCITLLEGNKNIKGTVYHEAFHAVMHLCLNEKERKDVIALLNEDYPALSDLSKEELLAEWFREYTENQEDTRHSNTIVNMFRKLWKFLTFWKHNKLELDSRIEKLFNNINAGQYKLSPTINYSYTYLHTYAEALRSLAESGAMQAYSLDMLKQALTANLLLAAGLSKSEVVEATGFTFVDGRLTYIAEPNLRALELLVEKVMDREIALYIEDNILTKEQLKTLTEAKSSKDKLDAIKKFNIADRVLEIINLQNAKKVPNVLGTFITNTNSSLFALPDFSKLLLEFKDTLKNLKIDLVLWDSLDARGKELIVHCNM